MSLKAILTLGLAIVVLLIDVAWIIELLQGEK